MTGAAEEVKRMTMAHNNEIFDDRADDAEDVHDSQQCNGNQHFTVFDFFAKSASNVFYRHHGLDTKNISTEACRSLSLSLNPLSADDEHYVKKMRAPHG